MNEQDRAAEEVDITPYEGKPDFDEAPTSQHVDQDELDGEGLQDDLVQSELDQGEEV